MIAKTTTALAALTLALAAALPAKSTPATDCIAMDQARATGLFEKWAAALPGHNPDLVLAFYAPGHSFKPHDAGAPMTERSELREYWTRFVDETPRAALKDASVEIGCNGFTKTGTKALTIDGETVDTAFTMAFENIDGTWLITRHEINPVAN